MAEKAHLAAGHHLPFQTITNDQIRDQVGTGKELVCNLQCSPVSNFIREVSYEMVDMNFVCCPEQEYCLFWSFWLGSETYAGIQGKGVGGKTFRPDQ